MELEHPRRLDDLTSADILLLEALSQLKTLDFNRRLLPIQGEYVPVHLGDIKVDGLLYYAGAVRIVYMMF